MSILAPNTDLVRPDCPLDWRAELRRAVRDPEELCRLLELPEDWATQAIVAAKAFPLLAPRPYVARMRKGDPQDPLLRQVLPLHDETIETEGFGHDPVGDAASLAAPGLLHKYQGRVLLVTTGACAVHCRYCFRRDYPYSDSPKGVAAWRGALETIAADETVREVILSGGDPLTLVDETLAALVEHVAAIPHIRRLRVHTRLPIVIPSRVTDELIAWLTGTRLMPIVVLHTNHANELDATVARALDRLCAVGVPLLNQAVLLRGVNDSVDAQAELCERLVNLRVMPYYLHQLDRVAGAAHFEAQIETGKGIMDALRKRLPGYAVPKYVREIPSQSGKTVLD